MILLAARPVASRRAKSKRQEYRPLRIIFKQRVDPAAEVEPLASQVEPETGVGWGSNTRQSRKSKSDVGTLCWTVQRHDAIPLNQHVT
eukprot:2818813-Amphidinium_carterae.2